MDHQRNGHLSQVATNHDTCDNHADNRSLSKPDAECQSEIHPSNENAQPTVAFECPVCLQTASFPVQLPCRHIFCFLCVKGVANRSKRCAMCRQEIPADFFNDPKLLHREEVSEMSKTIYDDGFQWFYEGRNGWWQYDERTSLELENRYKAGDKMFELLIAGFLYVIDLENMRQFRRNDQTRRRKIKRDMCNIPGVKGIAGIKYESQQYVRPSGDGGEASGAPSNGNNSTNNTNSTSSNPPVSTTSVINDRGPVGGQDDTYHGPPTPNNTPQAPMTPADSLPNSLSNSQEDLSNHLQNLHLGRSRPDTPEQDQPDQPVVYVESESESSIESHSSDEDENQSALETFDGVRETCL